MHSEYHDVYYEVKGQGKNNLARVCPTKLTMKILNTKLNTKEGGDSIYN